MAAVAQSAAIGVSGGVDHRAQLIKIVLAGIELANLFLGWVRYGHTAGWLSQDEALRLGRGRHGDAAIKTVAVVHPALLMPPFFFTGVVDALTQLIDFESEFVEPTKTIRVVRLHRARSTARVGYSAADNT